MSGQSNVVDQSQHRGRQGRRIVVPLPSPQGLQSDGTGWAGMVAMPTVGRTAAGAPRSGGFLPFTASRKQASPLAGSEQSYHS